MIPIICHHFKFQSLVHHYLILFKHHFTVIIMTLAFINIIFNQYHYYLIINSLKSHNYLFQLFLFDYYHASHFDLFMGLFLLKIYHHIAQKQISITVSKSLRLLILIKNLVMMAEIIIYSLLRLDFVKIILNDQFFIKQDYYSHYHFITSFIFFETAIILVLMVKYDYNPLFILTYFNYLVWKKIVNY